MTQKDAIERAYAVLGTHRGVARMLGLPLHVVMWTLGLMTDALYAVVNGDVP